MPKMGLDGVDADEETGRDLAVREALADEERDAALLRRQLSSRADATLARALPRRHELVLGALCPEARARTGEAVARGVQLRPGVGATSRLRRRSPQQS